MNKKQLHDTLLVDAKVSLNLLLSVTEMCQKQVAWYERQASPDNNDETNTLLTHGILTQKRHIDCLRRTQTNLELYINDLRNMQ